MTDVRIRPIEASDNAAVANIIRAVMPEFGATTIEPGKGRPTRKGTASTLRAAI